MNFEDHSGLGVPEACGVLSRSLGFRQDRQGKEQKKTVFVNFKSICMEMEGEDLSLIVVGTHFQFYCGSRWSYYLLQLKVLKHRG